MTRPERSLPRLAALALVALLPACKPLDYGPKSAYEATIEDLRHGDGVGGLTDGVAQRIAGRMDDVVAMHERGELQTAEDKLYACALLRHSDEQETLELAKTLGLEAVEGGRKEALPYVAEATDKLLLKGGLPQRYGTQLVYVPVLGRWRAYAVDPRTTDAERAAMGVPSHAEYLARLEQLNASALTRKLGGDGE